MSYEGLNFSIGTSTNDYIMFELDDSHGYLGAPQGYTIYLNYNNFFYNEYIGDGVAAFGNTISGDKFKELLSKGKGVVPEIVKRCNEKLREIFISALEPLGDIDYSEIEGFDNTLLIAKELSKKPLSILWKETAEANIQEMLRQINVFKNIIKKNEENKDYYTEEENNLLNIAIVDRVTLHKQYIKELENSIPYIV